MNRLQNDANCKYDLSFYNEKDPESNPYEWKTILEGAQGSIYEDGYYMVKIVFGENYPEEKPQIIFLNKIFHPHINSLGNACIRPPKKDIISVLDTVEEMFFDYDKDIDHAYPGEPQELYVKSKEEFIQKAKEWVKAYAKIEDLDKFY